MRIVFVSGFLNNHLLPFCDSLSKLHDFHFVATEDRGEDEFNRGAIGKDYVLYYFMEDKQLINDLVVNADVVIFGGSSDELLSKRKETEKLSFIYTERLFKKGKWRRLIPSIRRTYHNRFIENNNNIYILCASSYVKSDVSLIGFDRDRCFKFGYYPECENKIEQQDIERKKSNKTTEMLYVGRLIKLKRVGDIIRCTHMLKKKGHDVHLTIIGDGTEKEQLEKTASSYNEIGVTFTGAIPPYCVYSYMKRSNMLVLSSNKQEGWGAVVNEALSNGCPVLASDACGSATYLIKEGENGYVYKVGNIKDMTKKAEQLIQQMKDSRIYKRAFDTIQENWNGRIAAERFAAVCESLLSGEKVPDYSDGPMSHA